MFDMLKIPKRVFRGTNKNYLKKMIIFERALYSLFTQIFVVDLSLKTLQ